jgi:hypothetical protein
VFRVLSGVATQIPVGLVVRAPQEHYGVVIAVDAFFNMDGATHEILAAFTTAEEMFDVAADVEQHLATVY